MPNNSASGTAAVNRTGPAVTVKVSDSVNNYGVYTLTYNDVATGDDLATLAQDVNSRKQPNARYLLPRPAAITPGTVVLCFVTLVPVANQGPLQFTVAAFQGAVRIDDRTAVFSIDSTQPANAAIRLEFV